MRISNLTRRQLLGSTAGGMVLAPFVPLLSAGAAGDKPPLRLIMMYSSNGTVREAWLPTVTNGQLQLPAILAPLEKHKGDLVVIDGIKHAAGEKAQGGHAGGITSCLTGSVGKFVGSVIRAPSISVDQHIANTVSNNLKFKVVNPGVIVDTFDAEVCAFSYTGPMQYVFPENDPLKLYGRVFANTQLPSGGVAGPTNDRAKLARQSVIDYVRADLTALKPKLGMDDQQKIDRHLQIIREVEQGISTGAGAAASVDCKKPGVPSTSITNDSIPKIGELQMDLLVTAMACDLSRVGTLAWGRAGCNHRFTWLGKQFDLPGGVQGIHAAAHEEFNPTMRSLLTQMHTWYAGRVAALVDRLKATPEGNGTMMDNTLVVWFNEIGVGSSHSLSNVPWVLIGNAQKQLKTGRLLSVPGKPNNALLVSLCNLMGLVTVNTFGDPQFGSGPLPGLV